MNVDSTQLSLTEDAGGAAAPFDHFRYLPIAELLRPFIEHPGSERSETRMILGILIQPAADIGIQGHQG